MDEIEYKLKTNNSVLVVNAMDKLLSTIKNKYKPGERQRFVLENEELKLLREKCSSTETIVSLTACQGLLALVELGVLEIAHTMSTIVTLLPSAHNYTAIISTMAGLLILDLRSRLVPGQPYKCQFSLRSPQHPFITVLEKNKDAEDDVLAQMHALCTHPDYTISSNSLELLRPVFLWLTYNPQRSSRSIRPWQLLLSLPQSSAQSSLLLNCISCQQISNPNLIERAFAAYSAVTDAAVYQSRVEHVMAFLPILARVSTQLLTYGRDPRGCYSLIERCFALDAPQLRNVSGLTLALLSENLLHTSALYLHELFNLCLNIISKYEYAAICLNSFVGLSLQWLQLPSYLTTDALKVAANILEVYRNNKENCGLHIANLKSNQTFQALIHTEGHLFTIFKLLETYERLRDNPDKLKSWFDSVSKTNDSLKLQLLPFFVGLALNKDGDEELTVEALKLLVQLVGLKKGVSVSVLPILAYMIANDNRPVVKLQCLRGLPLMAATKENLPSIVSMLSKLKAKKGVPTSLLIMLYTSLAETQIRCFPYLQELLVDTTLSRPDDLKWEVDLAKAVAVNRVCELRASTHGLEVVSVISSILNRCTDKGGASATGLVLRGLAGLWRARAVAPPGTWQALAPRLAKDHRLPVQIALCELLSNVPSLRVSTPEYDKLVSEASRRLWQVVAEGNQPALVAAACAALSEYRIDDYKLKDIPEIYRRSVKLPASYCKTPADAARRPEDVLDYIPCEVWPEVFRSTNQSALSGIQKLTSKLLEREIRAYRSGVYHVDARLEPHTLTHLPATSVLRGLMDCFRKEVTSPSYDFPETALLAILQTLTEEYPKPLPPSDLSFLHELFHRGAQWRPGCVRLAARQAQTSLSARRFLETYLQGVQPGTTQESEILLIFDYLPVLCRGVPPNALRPLLERCLGEAYSTAPDLFPRQLGMMKRALECDRIHDANRTLLSQLLENYFSVIPDDSPMWPTYVQCCRALSTKYLERMSSPSGWWEVSGELLRKSCSLRAALGAARGGGAPLVWLNESVDAHAARVPEQEYSLRCMLEAFRAADSEADSTRAWLLQLMARTQVAFNETEEESAKLYLCDVFMLSVIVFSGVWSFEPDADVLVTSRTHRCALLPSAAAALLARDNWNECTVQMLEWLCHTRECLGRADGSLGRAARAAHAAHAAHAARAAHTALLALRHLPQFAANKIWMKMESRFGNITANED